MKEQNKRLWRVLVPLSIGLLVGVGTTVWLTPPPLLPDTQTHTDYQYDNRLGKLEQAMIALTQAVQSSQAKDARPEPTRVAVQANADGSHQDLAQVIREEVRHAMAEARPEAQRTREEAIAEAQILNSPENREAYQSASDVVHTAIAIKRWTDEAKETFHSAFSLLTNNQRMELMSTLAPAINRGEITVEVTGPLF